MERDQRTDIFTLWTDPKYEDVLPVLYGKTWDQALKSGHVQKVLTSRYRCASCSKETEISTESGVCEELVALALNPKKYLLEGEEVLCRDCTEYTSLGENAFFYVVFGREGAGGLEFFQNFYPSSSSNLRVRFNGTPAIRSKGGRYYIPLYGAYGMTTKGFDFDIYSPMQVRATDFARFDPYGEGVKDCKKEGVSVDDIKLWMLYI